ncbi:helicase-related protein [Micrococcus luteus]|uniref:helicase-related protein n=1 Tax=Micrococcus luteus TaxID=1270 RepID=UPI0011AFA230|nr:helicase-related protein [Micrococcus luteus]
MSGFSEMTQRVLAGQLPYEPDSLTRQDEAGTATVATDADSGPEVAVVAGQPWTGGTRRPARAQERFAANLAALEVLTTLDQEPRPATESEQEVLAGWSAWGALPFVFDEADTRISETDRARVRELLGPEGWSQARATTLNAHYTDPAVAAAMWDVLDTAGFEDGAVLEPGCGSGEFLGLAPEGARMVGVEVDQTTARIAAHLHPDQQIHAAGFEKTMLPEDSFHAVVGNVPFGEFSVTDPTHNAMRHSIHNHFIIKSLRLTAPGGYVAVMTSTYTMDSQRATARREMARYGDLVGAVRLPNGALQASAGTDVKTDVLVFRRRKPGEKIDQERVNAWVEPAKITVTDRDGDEHEVPYSAWFTAHPESVIGEPAYASSAFGANYQVAAGEGVDVAEQVRARLSEQVLDARMVSGLGYDPAPAAAVDTEAGLRFAPEPEAQIGHIRFNADEGRFEQYRAGMVWAEVRVAKKLSREARAILALRDKATEVMTTQRQGAPKAERERARGELRSMWESYTAQYGALGRGQDKYGSPSKADREKKRGELEAEWRDSLPQDGDVAPADVPVPEELAAEWDERARRPEFKKREQPHIAWLAGDPKLGLLRSMEVFDEASQTATAGALLTRDVVTHRTRPERAESVEDAIAISMDETRTVDVDRVAELLDVDAETARGRLAGEVFEESGTGVLVPKTTYLSGNVRAKLAAAREAMAEDSRFAENVGALEAVVPDEIALQDVAVNVGVRWVPEETYRQFVSETLKAQCQVRLNPGTDAWEVEVPRGGLDPSVRYAWGTKERTPAQLMVSAMNMKTVTVTKDVGDGERVKDETATAAARAKVEEIRAEFGRWMMADPDRVMQLQARYNDVFNSTVAPDYSAAGERLSLPGLSEAMTPYTYQRAAVARAVSEPTVLLDHVVGAGKTGSMIMSAMELKRTGIVSKPCMVVPNHLVDQIATEAVQWYPGANVIAVPTGLSKDERQEWIGQVAAGEWDLVVMPQTTFERVQIDPAKQAQWLKDAQNELESATAGEDQDAGWVKRSEKAKKTLERQHARIAANTDPGVTFEESGIDYLLVDEAHHYKNLARSSDLAELACAGSGRAMDLDFKLRALREVKTEAAERAGIAGPGYLPAVATFATGTPVANNMAEMWVMQHYLRPDLLEAAHADTVTAWGQAFTKVKPQLRPTVTGDGFQQVVKVSEYVNVPELLSINSTFTDVVLRDQLETTLPKVATGDRILMAREPSEQVAAYVESLKTRIEQVKNSPPVKGGDNMLVIVGDGRKVALDPRLVGLPADPDGGRVAAVADQIMTVHEQTKDTVYRGTDGEPSPVTGGLQIVFCDQSTPKGDGEWNVYQGLREELAARGMDPEKVAFIHDAKTDEARKELFEKCRDGRINVIVGSTQKMGTGTNIQARATALHHMDVPWRPADLEQREGRIIRQGNQNEEVRIYSWATQSTFDVYSWDMIARKAGFIAQVKNGQVNGRAMEDVVAGLDISGATAAAVLANDPRVLEMAQLQMDVEQLTRAQSGWAQQRATQRVELNTMTQRQQFLAGRQDALIGIAAGVRPTDGDAFAFTTTDGRTTTSREEAGQVIVDALRQEAARSDRPDFMEATEPEPVGTLGGVELGTIRQGTRVFVVPMGAPSVRRDWQAAHVLGGEVSAAGAIRSVENFVAGLPEQLVSDKAEADRLAAAIPDMQAGLEGAFPQAAELADKQRELAALKAEMEDEDQSLSMPKEVEYTPEQLEERGLIGHTSAPHEGDVWEYNKGFYAVGYTTDSVGVNQRELWAWPVGEEPTEAIPAYRLSSQGKLVVRREAGLSPLERECMTADLDRHKIVRRPQEAFGYDGEVLREVWVKADPEHRGPGTTPKVKEARQGRLDGNGNMIVSGTGEFIPNEDFVPHGTPMILLDATSPEKEAARRAAEAEDALKRWPREFLPGEVLLEDVPGFGYEGDIVRLLPVTHGSGQTIAVSPDTGQARDRAAWKEAPARGLWKTAAPVQLSEQERTRLWGAATTAVQVGQLRPGDTVMAADIDRNSTVKEAVTVLSVGYGGTKNVTYAGQDGEKRECTRKDTTVVNVHGRTRAALTVQELARLATPAGQPVKACPAKDIAMSADWQGRTLVVDTVADYRMRDRSRDGVKIGQVIGQEQTVVTDYGQRVDVGVLTLRGDDGATFQVSTRDAGHVWEIDGPLDATATFGGRFLEGSVVGPIRLPGTVGVVGDPIAGNGLMNSRNSDRESSASKVLRHAHVMELVDEYLLDTNLAHSPGHTADGPGL